MTRSARRQIVRARCRYAAAGEPPASTKVRNGASSALSVSISSSSRFTWLRVDGEPLAARPLALVGRAEVGREIEQIVLDAREHGVDRRRPLVCSRATPIAAVTSSTVP